MLEKAGNKKVIMPFVAVILLGCLLALMFYPMATMTPKDLPFAVLNLDEGVETPQGEVNAGDVIIDSITTSEVSEEDSEIPVTWTELSSQQELEEALENNEYYGALIVPADFSEKQVATQMAAVSGIAEGVEASSLEVVIDNAKSPLVASQLQTGMTNMFSDANVNVEIEVIHEGIDEESTSSSNPMISQQMSIMPLFLMSAIASVLVFLVLRPEKAAKRAERWKSIGFQFLLAAGVSLLVGITSFCIVVGVAGVELPALESILFFWLASFSIMLVVLGCLNVAMGLGILVIVLTLGFGMGAGVIPYEMLPSFWQDWVYPWAPQRFIGDGVRDIMFMDAGVWNKGSGPLLVSAILGTLVLCLSGLKKEKAEVDKTPIK